jgi:hypothetical protein
MNQRHATGDALWRRLRTTRGRFVTILLASFALALLICWHSLLPGSPASMPGPLTEHDKKEIARLCRRYTVRFSVDKLRRGEFGWFVRSVHVLFQQKIDRLIDDRDGTYRAYVVVYDKQAPDGFNPWSRHQLTKTNGHWTILRSY